MSSSRQKRDEKTRRIEGSKKRKRERERERERGPIDYFSPLLVVGTLHERNYDSLSFSLCFFLWLELPFLRPFSVLFLLWIMLASCNAFSFHPHLSHIAVIKSHKESYRWPLRRSVPSRIASLSLSLSLSLSRFVFLLPAPVCNPAQDFSQASFSFNLRQLLLFFSRDPASNYFSRQRWRRNWNGDLFSPCARSPSRNNRERRRDIVIVLWNFQ